MPGYNRPEGGWNYVFDGLNTVDAPDAIQPTMYPYARNIRGLADRSVRTRPGYLLFSTAPVITSECPLAAGQVDSAYSFTFEAIGGIPPYVWTVATGSLPTGLTLATSGVLSGTPSAAGLFSFTILVTDSAGGTDIIACSLYICPATEAGADWIGCLSGSFTVPGDWTTAGGFTVSGGQGNFGSVGFGYNTLGGCGSMLNTEVYAVYNGKTSGAGNHGYALCGPGARMNGSSLANYSGYFFTAVMWGGTINNTCTWNGSGIIGLDILKVNSGTVTTLASTTIAGPDLTVGIPMDIQVSVEGSGARCIATLGGTQMLSVLDSTAVLSSGYPGMAGILNCGGQVPVVHYSFIKARAI